MMMMMMMTTTTNIEWTDLKKGHVHVVSTVYKAAMRKCF